MPHGGPIHVGDIAAAFQPGRTRTVRGFLGLDAIRSASELIFYNILGFGDDGLLTSLDFSFFAGVESAADNIEDGDIGIMYERIDDEDEEVTFKLFHSIETTTPPAMTGILEQDELTPQEQAAVAFKIAEQAMDAIERGNGLQLKSALDQMSDLPVALQLAGTEITNQLQQAMNDGINIGNLEDLLSQGGIITQTSIDDLASGLSINIGSFELKSGLAGVSFSVFSPIASMIQTTLRSMI